ncbi:MAG TPA: DNA-binding protein [Candidatus Angelobacter sp.]|jgi:HEPN domain-containing protein|nr:DNA-binding protein [Candidatus Angelobacter sp.]
MAKIKRDNLQVLAQVRLNEARLLMEGGSFAGAYYLAGLAVECAFKACIARSTEEFEFPDRDRVKNSWSHDLLQLLRTAGLSDHLTVRIDADKQFKANWETVKDWNVESRYEQKSEQEARSIYNAIVEKDVGIIAWVEEFW